MEAARIVFNNIKLKGESISGLFIDVDYFKQVNDTYGHAFGDKVLTALTDTVNGHLRANYLFCRYGGEEFIILLSNATSETAGIVSKRILEEARNIRFMEHPEFCFTVSIGISSDIPKDKQQLESFIGCADKAMYESKHTGRDKITAYQGHIS
jgi:diguanylate cyclase (GGDEF)-like protein